MNMDIEILDDVLESLLFVSGDSLKVSDICELLEVQKSEVNAAVKRLQKRFGGKSGIHLISFNGQLQLASIPTMPILSAACSTPSRKKRFPRRRWKRCLS